MGGCGKLLLFNKDAALGLDRIAEGADVGVAAADIDADIGEGGDGDGLSDGASAVTDEDAEVGSDMGIFDEEAFGAGAEEESGAGGGEAGVAGIDVERTGGAGSSGDIGGPVPVPPPPGPPDEPRPARRKQKGALAVLLVPGGKITFYAGGNKDFMTAECNNLRHGRCVKTKTCEPPPDRFALKRAGQGRPVGWLVAWLRKGMRDIPREKHWAAEEEPTWAERKAARDEVIELQAGGSADAALLLGGEVEHKGAEGEAFEPAVIP